MRHLIFLALAAFGFAPSNLPAGEWTVETRSDLGKLPGGASAWKITVRNGDRAAILTGVTFSEDAYRLVILDNPSQKDAKRLSTAAPAAGAAAGINASFFHPDWAPLGLVVSSSKTIHAFEKARLLSGVLAQRGKKMELVRSGTYQSGADVAEAVQAGPWLVENGKTVPGLSTKPRTRRSLIATDGKRTWSFISISHATLAEAAEILTSKGVFPSPGIRNALNFDGGSSTALWADLNPSPLSIPEFGAVRNFAAIIPKKSQP